MESTSACPGREVLTKLLDDELPAAEQQSVQAHLDCCDACRQTLERLAGGVDSWGQAARHLAAGAAPGDPVLEQALGELEGKGDTVAEGGVAADDDFSFLRASEQPGHLGRLDHYEVLGLIGKGGMGIVFKAFDEALHRVVALKVMAPQLAASATARRRFVREAQAAAAVRDEHVINIHAIGGKDHVPYLVMEFVSGMSLQELLDRQGPPGLQELLRIAQQTARGLAAAHAQGLVHRDVKPGNILLENGVQRVKITDFGLARAADDASLTRSGLVAGTPMYMAPEQAAGEAVDHRADLFSLGSVLYTMCTGRPPFRASGVHAVLRRVIDDAPRPVQEINPEVPDWLSAVIARLHAKKPEDRYQSAREIADLLGEHLAHLQQPTVVPQPAAAPPRGPLAAKRKRRRGPLVAGAVVAGLALALAALGYLLWPYLWPRPAGPAAPHLVVFSDDPDLTVELHSRVEYPPPPLASKEGAAAHNFGPSPGEYEVRGVKCGKLYRREFVTLAWGEKRTFDWKMTDGWVQLFNGKDLTGWKSNQPQKWRVENGSLVGEAVGYLFSTGEHRDFHCRVEVKINADGVGGLGFRGGPSLGGGVLLGNGFNGRKTGSIYQNAGGKTTVVSPWNAELTKPGTWFVADIIVRGRNVVVRINGTETAQKTIADLPEAGVINVTAQGATTVVNIRKIEIRELPPGKAPPP